MFRSNKKQGKINRKPLRIRTGDEVIVISGRDRSNTPRKVLAVLPREGKVVVEGVNMMADYQKPQGGRRASAISQQSVIEKPFPIDRSKVSLVDPQSKKRTRVKMKTQPDGKRVRLAAKSGETI